MSEHIESRTANFWLQASGNPLLVRESDYFKTAQRLAEAEELLRQVNWNNGISFIKAVTAFLSVPTAGTDGGFYGRAAARLQQRVTELEALLLTAQSASIKRDNEVHEREKTIAELEAALKDAHFFERAAVHWQAFGHKAEKALTDIMLTRQSEANGPSSTNREMEMHQIAGRALGITWALKPEEAQAKNKASSTHDVPTKFLDNKTLRDDGYLQEVNRGFFHPLGLALGIEVEGDLATGRLRILDYRHDPEGVCFADGLELAVKAKKLWAISDRRKAARQKALGYWQQRVRAPFNTGNSAEAGTAPRVNEIVLPVRLEWLRSSADYHAEILEGVRITEAAGFRVILGLH
jgi:hypothetical protein